jgi:hypothetical protein
MGRRRGITTIALVVVGVVTATVAALAVIATAQYQAAARRTAGLCSLKQLGVAAHMYHDMHHRLPPAHDGTRASHAQLAPQYEQNTTILLMRTDYSAPLQQDATATWTSFAANYYLFGSHSNSTADITAAPDFAGLPDPQEGKDNFGYTPLAFKEVSDGSSNTMMWVSCLARPAGHDVVIHGDSSKPGQATGPFTAWLDWEPAPKIETALCMSGKHAQSFDATFIQVGLTDGGARSIKLSGSVIYANLMLPNDRKTPFWDY